MPCRRHVNIQERQQCMPKIHKQNECIAYTAHITHICQRFSTKEQP